MATHGKLVIPYHSSGTICSSQVKAFVHLVVDLRIVGRSYEKSREMALALARTRAGSKVIGISTIDVCKLETLEGAIVLPSSIS
jgi:hypothetical protein